MKKWRDLSNELHETTVTLKNEFQETSLGAATFSLVGSNLSEDKSSTISKPEVQITTEMEETDNLNDKSDDLFSRVAHHPTSAY